MEYLRNRVERVTPYAYISATVVGAGAFLSNAALQKPSQALAYLPLVAVGVFGGRITDRVRSSRPRANIDSEPEMSAEEVSGKLDQSRVIMAIGSVSVIGGALTETPEAMAIGAVALVSGFAAAFHDKDFTDFPKIKKIQEEPDDGQTFRVASEFPIKEV